MQIPIFSTDSPITIHQQKMHRKEIGVWNFLLILALSRLDITVIQISKALQNETYLPPNKQKLSGNISLKFTF